MSWTSRYRWITYASSSSSTNLGGIRVSGETFCKSKEVQISSFQTLDFWSCSLMHSNMWSLPLAHLPAPSERGQCHLHRQKPRTVQHR